jgi:hypothetical protein
VRLALLVGLALASGCASPKGWSGAAPKVIGLPLLTWIDGDPDEGTTTFLSAPILTYRGSTEAPGYTKSDTCFVPLLAHKREIVRELKVVAAEPAPGCPGDPLAPAGEEAQAEEEAEEGKPLSSREKARRGISVSRPERRGPRRRRATESRAAAEDEEPVVIPGRERPVRRKAPRREPPEAVEEDDGPVVIPGRKPKEPRGPRAVAPPTRAPGKDWKGLTLRLDEPGRVLKHTYPAVKTELDVLWPLVRFARERPAKVGFHPHAGPPKVFEVGPESTEVRILPLFSHSSDLKGSQTIIWPLLGFGWETSRKGTYLRLFYFLRFKID